MENTNNHKVELLAPAGSFITLRAAINAGCDSVYFGISDFNMRASAAVNFTMDDLPEAVRIANEHNVKTYVTVNTLLYNEDLQKMRDVVDAVKKAGATAVIVADMATILYARSQNMEVHISTQLSISNIESVKFYSQFTDRIVLARELSLEQVKTICDQIKEQNICGPSGDLLEIEVFAHGALCVAVSGRCAMSLYCNGTSANRGKCSQVCRRRYKVTDIDTGQELEIDNNYVMSASDLCTVGMLDKLVDSGVSALKIEGRGRGPEYVDTVIRTYREALNSLGTENYNQENITKWRENLGKAFNRGFSQGLYMGRSFDEWSGVSGNKSPYEKVFVGKVLKYYPKVEVAHIEILVDRGIKNSDEYAITGATTGIVRGVVQGLQVEDKPAESAGRGVKITMKTSGRVREGDEFYVMEKKS